MMYQADHDTESALLRGIRFLSRISIEPNWFKVDMNFIA